MASPNIADWYAMKVFKLLEQNKFEVEDIYFEDKNKSYQILNFN
jgi:hypothetical protein